MRNSGIKLTLSAPLLFLSMNTFGAIHSPDLMIKPVTDPYVNIPMNEVGAVKYLLTNKGNTNYQLQANPIQGFTQETGKPKLCGKDIDLSPGKSCVLSFVIDGSEAVPLTRTGPILCETGWAWSNEAGFDAKTCIQPELNDRISVNFVSPTKATLSIKINTGKHTEATVATNDCFASMKGCALTLFKNSSTQKSITLTNTSKITATDIQAVNLPPGVSQDASNCKALSPSNSCRIYFKAGNIRSLHQSIEIKGNNLASTFMNMQALDIDDAYRGGIIACMKGPFRNLIVASVDNSDSSTMWGMTGILTSASSRLDGKRNTKKIIKALGDNNDFPYAAQVCANYEVDSEGNTPCKTGTCYNQWFLPAKTQMACLYKNAWTHGFQLKQDYWTSTETPADEHGADSAYVLLARSGAIVSLIKFQGASVRCVSSFNPN